MPSVHPPHVLPPHRYLRQAHPYFNASGGSDHFYFSLNDRGACILNSSDSDLWAPIKLVHFGAYSGNLTTDLGLDPWIKGRLDYGCFQPGKDIVVAPHQQNLASMAHETFTTEAGRKRFSKQKEVLLAFAGGAGWQCITCCCRKCVMHQEPLPTDGRMHAPLHTNMHTNIPASLHTKKHALPLRTRL
jgi:hypothetical protein